MNLAFDEDGRGVPVVLLHAFPLCRAMWRPQREGLRDHCRLILPDLPGFGDSPLMQGAPTVETMADAVAGLLDARGVREPVILGGLSMGGYVTLAFARKYPDRLRGVILADTRADGDDDAARANRDKLIGFAAVNPASAVVEQMAPRLLGETTRAHRPEVVAEVRRLGSAQRPAGILAALQAMRNRPDSTALLNQFRVPVLVIVGREDALTPPALAEGLASRIANARVVVVEEAGHLSNLEQPSVFSDAIKAFLQAI